MNPDQIRKPDACPSCGGTNVKPIMYGLPSNEGLERAARGDFVLGGCVVRHDRADWRCMDCDHAWYDPNDPARIRLDEMLDEARDPDDEKRQSQQD